MSKVEDQSWFQQWSYKVVGDIEQCTDWGATLIVLVAIKGTMDNYVTLREYPSLLERLQQGMEQGKIKTKWSNIEERRIDLKRLSQVVKSDAQGSSYVVIASCPNQLMDQVKTLVKGNRNVMASWATTNDLSSLNQDVANVSLGSVNESKVHTKVYPNGDKYEGDMNDGKPYGQANKDGGSKNFVGFVMEATAAFITILDLIALDRRSTAELQPELTGLLRHMNKIPTLPPDFSGKAKIKTWLATFSGMTADEALDDTQAQQLQFDLTSEFDSFKDTVESAN